MRHIRCSHHLQIPMSMGPHTILNTRMDRPLSMEVIPPLYMLRIIRSRHNHIDFLIRFKHNRRNVSRCGIPA